MKFKKFEKTGEKKDFLKIEPDCSAVVILRGEPHDFRQHWSEGEKPVVCAGKDCPACQAGIYPSTRFQINAAVYGADGWVNKIWEGSKTVYQQLAALAEAGYELDSVALRIVRSGSGKDTRYNIVPSPKPPSGQDFDAISKLPLVSLGKEDSDDDMPF